MKVKQLIKELRKLPQDIDVNVSMQDNSRYEIAGHVCTVSHFIKEEYQDEVDLASVTDHSTADMFDAMPEECVILEC